MATTNLTIAIFLQMVGMYKDPKGENIFANASNVSKSVITSNEDAVPSLMKRIQKLEEEIKEKDVCTV